MEINAASPRLFKWEKGEDSRFLTIYGKSKLWRSFEEEQKFFYYIDEQLGRDLKGRAVCVFPQAEGGYSCSRGGEELFAFTKEEYSAQNVPQYLQIHELTLKTFKEKKAETKLLQALTWFFQLITSPFAQLYHAFVSDSTVASLPGESIEHNNASQLNPDTILSQLKFVQNMFVDCDPKSPVVKLLEQAYETGVSWETLQKKSLAKQRKAIHALSEKIREEQLTVIPYGEGEGKDYIQHFLILSSQHDNVLIKDFYLTQKEKKASLKEYKMPAESSEEWLTALFHAHPVESKKAAKERHLNSSKEPTHSLEILLRMYGKQQGEKREFAFSSRDPVKLFYGLVKELGEETFITESKTSFYSRYVEQLINYYEKKERSLSSSEKIKVLKTLQNYADQVRLQIQPLAGDVAAEHAVISLKSQIEAKLNKVEESIEYEKKVKKNLNEKGVAFRALLSRPIQEGGSDKIGVKEREVGEGMRVSVEVRQSINAFGSQYKKENKTVQLTEFKKLIEYGEQKYLEQGELKSAYSFYFHLLRTLPPANHSFWKALDAEELLEWINQIEELSERIFESAARSGVFPLPPRESTEFNVKLPILIRNLLDLRIGQGKFLEDYGQDVREKIQKADEQRIRAVIEECRKKRCDEIEELAKEEWAFDDKRAARVSGWTNLQRKERRARDLKERKRTDSFVCLLQTLKDKDTLGDHLIRLPKLCVGGRDTICNRRSFLLGKIAKEIGLDRKKLSYALFAKHGVKDFLRSHTYLRSQDPTQLSGLSPEWDRVILDSKESLDGLTRCSAKDEWMTNEIVAFLAGLDGLGKQEELELREGLLKRSLSGCHNRDYRFLTVPETASLYKQTQMMRILEKPGVALCDWRTSRLGAFFNSNYVSRKEAIHRLSRPGRRLFFRFGKSSKGRRHTLLLSSSREKNQSICGVYPLVYIEDGDSYSREKYLGGELSIGAAKAHVRGDNERKIYKNTVCAEGFERPEILIQYSTGLLRPDDTFSYLSVKQCFTYIYQYPEVVVENEKIRQLLFSRLFQFNLCRQALLEDPEFFIEIGQKIEHEFDLFFRKRGVLGDLARLFLMEIAQRIREQAYDLALPQREEISKNLPAYSKDFIVQKFGEYRETEDQRAFALYMLGFYTHVPPTDFDDWKRVIEAVYYLQKSKAGNVHFGLEYLYLQHYQEILLPKLCQIFQEQPRFACTFLNHLSGGDERNEWNESKKTPYLFQSNVLRVDLITLEGISSFSISDGKHVLLPEKMKQLVKETGCELYEEIDFVDEVQTKKGNRVTSLFSWKSSLIEAEYQIEYEHNSEQVKIYQKNQSGRYLFQKLELTSSKMQKIRALFSSNSNSTLETMINEKGVWIKVNQEGKADYNEIYLAQENQDLNWNKEPIQLECQGKRILNASVGMGKNKLFIMNGLKNPKIPLLPFRDTSNLLLLSRNKKTIDEIRFPKNGHKRAFILKREKADWVVKGRAGWKWNQQKDPLLEDKFGKDWSDYVLPLISSSQDKKEYLIFPYLISQGGKRGAPAKLLRTPKEILQEAGKSLDALLDHAGMGDDSPLKKEDILGLASVAFQAGKMHEIAHQMGASSDVMDMTLNVCAISSPSFVTLHENAKGIFSSPAGFLYLAMKSAASKDYKFASDYIKRMLSHFSVISSEEEFNQLKKMIEHFFTTTFINRESHKSPAEIAFLLRTCAAIFSLAESLGAEQKRDLLDAPFSQFSINVEDGISIEAMMRLLASLLYGVYQSAIVDTKTCRKLKNYDLILSPEEEDILGVHLFPSSVLYSEEVMKEVLSDVPESIRKLITPFVGMQLPEVKPLPTFSKPTREEVRIFASELIQSRESESFSSIQELHAKKGADPKWDTVLSHFWDYYEWIFKTGVTREEISFLFKELPQDLYKREAVDIARRLLIHHYEEQRTSSKYPMELKTKEFQKSWKKLPLDGEREANLRYLQREFYKNPTIKGFVRYKGYEKFMAFRKKFVERLAIYRPSALPAFFLKWKREGKEAARASLERDEAYGKVYVRQTAQQVMLDLIEAFLYPNNVEETQPFFDPASHEVSFALKKNRRGEEIVEQAYLRIQEPFMQSSKIDFSANDAVDVKAPLDLRPFFEEVPMDFSNSSEEFLSFPSPKCDMERHHLERVQAGVKESQKLLQQRLSFQLKKDSLLEISTTVEKRFLETHAETIELKHEIEAFIKRYQETLGLSHFYVAKRTIDHDQIFKLILQKYEEGKLNIFITKGLHEKIVSLITHYLLAATEEQQLRKAKSLLKELYAIRNEQHPIAWRDLSCKLLEALQEGCNRARYLPIEDVALARHYLLFDYRNGFISRAKAREIVEAILKDSDERLHILRMGLGKTTFIAPLVAEELIRIQRKPICVTTKELILQLKDNLGPRAFVFEFGLDFKGEIEKHLDRLIRTLESLSEKGRFVVTTPDQLALLRNKRVLLQDALISGDKTAFGLLEKVKRIESYFHGEDVVYIPDEDVNLAINLDYNVAIGKEERIHPIRLDVAEKLMLTILDNPNLCALKEKLLQNDLRSVTNIKETLYPLAVEIVRDVDYWEKVCHFENYRELIANREKEFVDYLLGYLENPPAVLPPMGENPEEQQRALCHLTTFRTYLSSTFETVVSINPLLKRGIRMADKITPVPYEDGEEKVNTLYATEGEYVLHGLLHYLCGNSVLNEKKFTALYKTWKESKESVSPNSDLTWSELATAIASKGGMIPGMTLRPFQILSGGGAHRLDKSQKEEIRLACVKERLFFFRALAETSLPIFRKQVTCNSQDIFLGEKCHLLSGTGDPFTLGLLTEKNWNPEHPDLISGETINLLDLHASVARFDSPQEHIEMLLGDFNCKAVLNQDYALDYSRPENLIRRLRDTEAGSKRQFIFRHSKTKEKMIWEVGALEAIPYSPEMVRRKESFFYFAPADRRGVDFAVPQGEHFYASAMVGVGIDADTCDQLLWRMRQLGTGQKVYFAFDQKLERHIRNYFENTELNVLSGHMIRYIHHITNERKKPFRTKAAIFQSKKPLKMACRVLSEPYHTYPISEEETLEPLSGEFEQILFRLHREFFIVEDRIDWRAEYGEVVTEKRQEFLIRTYSLELKKLHKLRNDFELELQLFLNKHLSSPFREEVQKVIESNHSFTVPPFLPDPKKRSWQRIIEKAQALLEGYREAETVLNERLSRLSHPLENPKSTQFYASHLPEENKIFALKDVGDEQQVELIQEQERAIEQVQEQRAQKITVESNYDAVRYTYPLNLYAFAEKKADWTYHPLPIPRAFISIRARELLDMIGPHRGYPTVYLLVLKEKKGGDFRSCVITPAEWDEQIAGDLRRSYRSISIYALSSHAFKLKPLLHMDRARGNQGGRKYGLTLEDEFSSDFISLMALNKMWLGWMHLTQPEWDYLRFLGLGDALTRFIRECPPHTANLLTKMLNPLEHKEFIIKQENLLFPRLEVQDGEDPIVSFYKKELKNKERLSSYEEFELREKLFNKLLSHVLMDFKWDQRELLLRGPLMRAALRGAVQDLFSTVCKGERLERLYEGILTLLKQLV